MKTRFYSGLLLCSLALVLTVQTAMAQTVPAPNWGTKLLTKITDTTYGSTGLFEYDDYGRLTKYSYDNNHEVYYYTYTDSGIEYAYSSVDYGYQTEGSANIESGKLTSGYLTGERAMTFSAEYDKQGRISYWYGNIEDWTNNMEPTWTGDNITTMKNVRNGSVRIQADFYYDESKSAPFVLQMLILGEFGSVIGLNNIGPTLQFFMYCGDLSANLLTSSQRIKKGKTKTLYYNYEYDAEGNIVRLSVSGDDSATYEFEWTDNPAVTVGINSMANKSVNHGCVYSLSGQRLSAPRHGINLRDGKKFVVK